MARAEGAYPGTYRNALGFAADPPDVRSARPCRSVIVRGSIRAAGGRAPPAGSDLSAGRPVPPGSPPRSAQPTAVPLPPIRWRWR